MHDVGGCQPLFWVSPPSAASRSAATASVRTRGQAQGSRDRVLRWPAKAKTDGPALGRDTTMTVTSKGTYAYLDDRAIPINAALWITIPNRAFQPDPCHTRLPSL